MRRLSGFSLMEMMIVLLIVAIVAAASAPMINKKMLSSASERSPWVWTGQDNNIAFNMNSANNSKVTIGAINPPDYNNHTNRALLYVHNNNNYEQISLSSKDSVRPYKIRANKGFFHITGGDYSDSIAIGGMAQTSSSGAVSIGSQTSASKDSIAIGRDAHANHDRSVAIGAGVKTSGDGQIMLGDSNTRVVVPGELYVTGNVFLAGGEDKRVYARVSPEDVTNKMYMLIGSRETWGWTMDIDGNKSIDYNQYKTWVNSDRRLKNVGKPSTAGLEEIRKLEVFNYTYKKDKSKTPRVGVMAQDLQKIFPNAVTKGEDGFLMIRMEDMFYAMVNAVKELANRDDSQAKKIQELEKQNKELIKRLEALEKNVNKKSK